MSKRVTTAGYIGAWVVWVIGFIAYVGMIRAAGASTAGPSVSLVLATMAWVIAVLVMVVMLIGALVKLGMQSAWVWFGAVLVLHVIGLGIVGMVAYAIAGPRDDRFGIVRRPTVAG